MSLCNRHRCAVLVSGFYEWHTDSTNSTSSESEGRSPKRAKKKAATTTPYFIYDSRENPPYRCTQDSPTRPTECVERMHDSCDAVRSSHHASEDKADRSRGANPDGYIPMHRPLLLAGLYEPHAGNVTDFAYCTSRFGVSL